MLTWDAATREEYEERAAIMQFDGGLPRAEAERRARAIIERKLKQPEQMDLIGPETTGEKFFKAMQERFGKW
jgi:hypothetical protein